MKSTIYDWMKEGYTLVPNSIFNHFSELDITSDELVLILYLLSQNNQGQSVEEINRLSNQLGWPTTKLVELLNNLMTKEYLSIELKANDEGKQTDHYTLRPLFEKLDHRYYENKLEVAPKPSSPIAPNYKKDESIVAVFEREFGRVLTPLELETLNDWIQQDKYDEGLIRLALKEAVIHQAISLNYIDKILLNWEKKNIRTIAEAEREIERFSNRNQPTQIKNEEATEDYDQFEIPLYNWSNLNDND